MISLRTSLLSLLCLLAWSGPAQADQVRFGLGAGLGAYPVSSPNLLSDLHLDVELTQQLTPFAAVGTTVLLVAGRPLSVFAVPAVDLGARWHFSHSLAVGLAGTVGVVVASFGGATVVPVAGPTLEAIQWTIAGHHELALRVSLLFPLSKVPDSAPGPFFSVLPLPRVTWTYRF